MHFATIVDLSLEADQLLGSFDIFNNEVTIAIELFFLIFQEDNIQYPSDFAFEIVKNLLSLADVRNVPEVYP